VPGLIPANPLNAITPETGMSEQNLPLNRPLTEIETEEFRALGLTPGNWLALAPSPLFRGDLNTPSPDDSTTLAKIQQPLRLDGTRPQDGDTLSAEAESFWRRLCHRSVSAEAIELANALLAWSLATRVPRPERETFLFVVDRIAAKYFNRARLPLNRLSDVVRQALERYLPQPVFTRLPADPHVAPPQPAEVAEVLGIDLWKQLLVAPIAAALGELPVRPTAAANVVEVLARVSSPQPLQKHYPLEPYLAAGCWRRLFEGLLDPLRREATEPVILKGLEIAARGLASLPFGEREFVLKTVHEQIERGIDRSDLKRLIADEWLDRVRIKVEAALRQATPRTLTLPPVSAEPGSAGIPRPLSVPRAALETGEFSRLASLAALPKPVLAPIGTSARTMNAATVVPGATSNPVSKPRVAMGCAPDFATVPWNQVFAAVSHLTVAEIRHWLDSPERPALLFDEFRTECSEVAIVRPASAVPNTLWVIGDLHSDALTLANIIAHAERTAEREGEPPSFLFLGDFVDRGRHDHETLLLLFQLIRKDPRRVCVVPGNHDIDLQWDDKTGRFRVTIEPAEYCERLNACLREEDPASRERVELAKLLIPFWQSRPKAVILPDGTLFAHGGFPHTDMHASLRTPADLGHKNCVNDFLWARIAESARKRPNRGNRGHEFGWDTFAQFCKVTTQLGVPPIKRFVRGHDHVLNRWQEYPDYAEHPVLTLNAMGWRMEGEADPAVGPHPFPVMARHVPNQLPLVWQLPLDPNEVNRALGKELPAHENVAKLLPQVPSVTAGEETKSVTWPPALSGGDTIEEVAQGVRLDPLHNLMPKPGAGSTN
jgi:hypothetical protein